MKSRSFKVNRIFIIKRILKIPFKLIFYLFKSRISLDNFAITITLKNC
jgi:hypothetical protein